MSDWMADSAFSDGASSDFAPATKKKAAPKKASAAAKPKAKAAPVKKTTQSTLKVTKIAKPPASKKRTKADSDDDEENIDHDTFNDDSLLSNTPPSAKKLKKAPAPKKSSGKALQAMENESFEPAEAAPPAKAGAEKQKYQMLTPIEHILKRPDTYIGSIERTDQEMWVYNSTTDTIEFRKVNYVPGLYKIFDEVLVNAADNKQNDKNMDKIKVTVNRESGEISVQNNGKGIPIEMHSVQGIMIPEMIFGHLLTSSNYDDDQQKITGGRNGYGAKLTNIYSVSFTVETADHKHKKKYKQTWTDNMSKMGKAKITAHSGDDYTKVTFTPDYAKFGMDGMDDDLEALIKRRIYDMAGTIDKVKVELNGERVKVKNFKDYMTMYTKAIRTEQGESENSVKDVILIDKPHERWEVGFAVSDGAFKQVSFVNSIATTSGGSHVNYVADQIITKLIEHVKKINKKGVQLKPAQIKNHLFLFVNCQIVNPAFTSQTKEQLTTKSAAFGSKFQVSDKFLNGICKTEVIANIMHFAEKKADQLMSKSDGSKRARMNNAKLTDANKAGTRDGWRCTLILTEGDSASGLALAGRAVMGSDYIGVFPLRGKLLNVRDASVAQITANEEIQNIKKFMGLQHKKEYTDVKGLRYGKLMIMTDQDHDGSHIKGLLINFLETQFPSLLKIDDFLNVFITPIVKVWKGDIKHPKSQKSFFTMPEYENWKALHRHEKGWDHKYFKGLGTSTNEDAAVYFGEPDRHLKQFDPIKQEEVELIDLAFSKKKADARKNWLRDFVPGTFLDMTARTISYDDFVNKELILFSMADNLRSIPSVVDGLKPSQRKVLYTAFRRNLKKDMKVVELAGLVSGLTNYAYGDTSLQQTIVGLAQNFVGSNNINLLEPSGNFGSRRMGGSDAASARYIYTRLSPFARRLFNAADEPLLTYHEDDGKQIEPLNYVPVVPLLLLNGADGIGTGWSTQIPNYKPEDIVENLKRRMNGTSKADMEPMIPWFRGYHGTTESVGTDKWKFEGIITQSGDNEVRITELPIRIWTQDFKAKLEEIIKGEKIPSWIKDYTEYNTPTKVDFIIKLEDKQMKAGIDQGLIEKFKLSKQLSTTNLVAFDGQGRMQKYETVLDMMEEFYHIRLKLYGERKRHLLEVMQKELDKMSNQRRFIKMVIDNTLVVYKKKKAVLVQELKKLGFTPFAKVDDAKKAGEVEDVVENDEESDADVEVGAQDYDYLLGLPIWSLTYERIEKLNRQIGDKEEEIDVLTKQSPKDLWITDLDNFLAEWNAELAEEEARAKKLKNIGRRGSAKLGIEAAASKRKRKDEDDDYDFGPKKKAAVKPKTKSALSAYFDTAPVPSVVKKPKEVVKPKAEPSDETLLGTSPAPEPMDVDEGSIVVVKEKKAAPASKQLAAAVKAVKPAVKKPVLESSDNEDIYADIAEEAPAVKAPARQARAAAKKTTYHDSDNDDLDDVLGDVSNMVKGIPSTTNGASDRTLFTATTAGARPTSSNGLKPKIARKPAIDLSMSDDETDYKNLVPQGSPERPAPRNVNDTILDNDDSEDTLGLSHPKPKTKTLFSASKGLIPKKPIVTKKAPEKTKTLSPAAKAYGAKQTKVPTVKPAAKPLPAARKKKVVESDEEEEIANDILDDDESDEEEEVVPMKRTAGRRAAATKKYNFDESSEVEDASSAAEESEDDFDEADD